MKEQLNALYEIKYLRRGGAAGPRLRAPERRDYGKEADRFLAPPREAPARSGKEADHHGHAAEGPQTKKRCRLAATSRWRASG